MATGPDDTLPPWERFSPSAPTADTDQADPVVDDENDDGDALDMEDEADDESVAQSGSGGSMSAVKATAPSGGNDLPPWERFKAPAPVQAPKVDSPAPAGPGAPSDIMGRFQRLDSMDAPAPAAPTQVQMPRAPRGTFHPSVESAIEQASQNHGVDPDLLRTFARIESGGDPRQRTGSYKGIMQLSDREFARHGGSGDIYDPVANVNAGAIKLKAESADFERKYGRAPTASELYLIHQQGEGGAANHWANPDAPAWENMYRTAEGRQKGPAWARQAIWGNVPDDVKRQYGSVDNITSGDFVSLWDAKVNRLGGGQPTRVAAAPSPTKSDAPDLGNLMALPPEERIGALRQYMKTEFGVDVPAPPTQVAQAPVNSDLPPWERFKTPGAKTDKAAAPSDDRWEITKGFVGGMLYGHPENFGNAVEGFGHILGSDAMVKKGGEWADWGKKNLESGYKARVPSFTDIRTSSVGDFLSDLGSYAGYGVGQGVSSSAPSLVMGTVGGLATANPYIGIAVGAFGPSYIQNFGDVYGSAKDDDGIKKRLAKGELTQKDLAATSTLAAVPMAALDVLGLEAVLGGSVFSQAKKDLSRRLVTGMVTGAVAEAPTEGMQEIISQWAQHWLGSETTFKEKFIKVVDNFLIGGLTGGAMGAAGSVRGGASPPAAPSPEPPKSAVAVPEAPPIPGQAGTFAAGPDGQPAPAPAAPPSAPPAPDEAAILRQMGYSPEHIADMSPDERAAELANAAELGIKTTGKAADAPTAEPIGDLVAQAKDLADPNNERKGLYLSPDNVATVQSNPAWLDQLGAALTNKGGMVQNVDGNGGVLLTKDQATADAVRKALEAGVDSQTVLGAVTGAGTGKPADASAVVQQRTPDGAVTRESAVAQGDIAATERNLKAPGRTVETVTPQEAIARREEGIAQARTTPPPLPNGDGTRSSPVRIASADDVSAAASAAASDYTPAQGEANNRKLGHAKWNGLDISLETDAGGIRRGLDPKTGQPWESRMAAPYGYFKGTKGADGMHVDVFMGPNPENGKVFVIDEKDRATGKFRQHKTFVGFDSEQDAVNAYVNSSNKSPEMIGGVTEMDPGGFKDWLTKGKRTRPVSDMSRNAGETVASPAETVATDQETVATAPGNSFTDQDIEALTKAWRYVNAIEQARGAGRDIQQKRLDIANELDADLASYGIAFGDFPDERSLRQYLSERRGSDQGGNAQVEEAQSTQEEAPPEAAARTPARSGRAQGEEAPVGEPRQDHGGPAGTRQDGRGTEVGKSRRYDGEPLSADEIDAVVDAWRYVSEEDAKPKPQSLTRFVIAAGGVNDQSREVRHIAGAAKERPGLVNSRGMDLDDAARIAWESGFLGDSTDRPTVADFLEKLQDDLHTGAVVRTADEPRLEDIRIAAEMAEELSSYGITPRRFRSEQAVRDYFGQGRESNPATSAPREEPEAAAVERESPARPAEADEVTKAPETGPSDSKKADPFKGEMPEMPDFDFIPNEGWRDHLMRARVYATALRIDHRGKSLEEIVKAIDEATTKHAGAAIRRAVHFTNAEFRTFDLDRVGSNDAGGPFWGRGIYFYPREYAENGGRQGRDQGSAWGTPSTGSRNIPVRLKFQNPFVATNDDGKIGGDFRALKKHGYPHNGPPVTVMADKSFASSAEASRAYSAVADSFSEALLAAGYDGIVVKRGDGTEYEYVAIKPGTVFNEVTGEDMLPATSVSPARGENAAPAQTSGRQDAFAKATAEAKSYVLTKGKADGKEHGMTVRPDGSTVVASTEGNRTNFIAINETQTPELYQDTERVLEFHHNHPSSMSFSRSDIVMGTMLKSLKRLHAHGHNGNSYAVDFLTSDASEIDKAFNTANDKLQAIVRPAIADGKITRDVGNAYHWHMVNTMLAEAGFTKYEADFASKRKAKADVAAYRKLIGSAWSRILTEIGVPKNVSDQRSDSIRDTARVEVAPAQAENARPERAASEEGNERGRGDNQADGSQGRDARVALRDRLLDPDGGFKTIVEARKFAKSIGIDGSAKQVDEAIEATVVAAAREIVKRNVRRDRNGNVVTTTADVKRAYSSLVSLYDRQPNLASRTGTSVANQAYSTPMPLAYLASRLAGVAAAKTIYEPTAGNGALLIEANPADQTVHANELDPNRAAALKAQGFDATSKDGSIAPGVRNIDSVIMNPPFGAVKEGGKSKTFYVQSSTAKTRADSATWSTTQIDHAIALNGLEAMADDGRAVLILGGTKSADIAARRKDYRGKAKREFYYRLYGQYNVTDHFTVSGDLYSKQGASWPVDVIVIEGRGKSARALPAAEPPAILTSWDQLAEKLPDATGRNELAPRKADEQTGSAPEAGGEPATGDGKPEPTTDRGGSEPLQSKAEGKPQPVRAERDRGQPADVGSGERDAASETRSDRDGGRTDNTADSEPVRPRVKREKKAPSGGEARYEPVSNVASLDTLIPVNMAGPARNAMERVSERHGDLDEFVSERLGYDKKDLGRYFSAEQIDALASAIDNVERGSAQIVGDQTGIGKGRIAAGMLRYAMKRGMVPVFVTEKPDLYGDMFRDLRDIGVPEMLGRDVRMFMTNAGETITLDEEALFWKQEVEEAKRNGEKPPKRRGMFLVGGTVAKVNEGMRAIAADENEKGKIGDVVFTTYDQLNTVKGATTPRRQFLSSIAPRAMIILDEAHNAGGGGKKGSEKKDAVANRADFARDLAARAKGVMFSSATYAKRPDVMDLYARTDMGKAVDDPKDLPDLIQRGGVPMQQIVASMLAESGQYIRRERSFNGVEYALEPVPVDLKAYKQFSASMQAIFKFDLAVEEFRKEWGNDALDQRGWAKKRDEGVGSGSANSTSFGALMHNITNQMLLAIKAEQTAKRAIAAHKAGEKPVIALANTNESFIKDFAEQEGIKIGSTLDLDFSAVLDRYLTRTLRVTVTGPEENAKAEHLQIPLKDLPASLQQEFRNAQNLVQAGDYSSLPISPIDWIRYRLGEAGMSVKEVTGRQTMIDYASPAPKYVARPKSEMGASGKRGSIAYFNAGRLDALILNRSGSTGVSMHASATFKDKRKRRMILAQAEGNIDTHCLDEKTEVLTPSGFKGIADKFDAVAAFDPATGAISWEPVTGRVERPLGADEVMYGILSPALDIRVTNKHRMLMKHRRQSIGWRLETAEFLGARRGGWRMPVSGLQPPTQSCPLTDHELGFIGWVLTDGTINYQSRQIVIWQAEHQPHHEHIKACLEGCGFKYGVTENRGETQYNRTYRSIGYTISLGQWRHLKEYLNKDFPVAFEALDRRQLSVLLHALHLGDGTKFLGQPWTARSYHIATGRKTFAERLQSLCVRRGYRCNVSVQSYNLNPLYMIRIKDKIEQHVGGVNHGDGRPYFGPVDFDKSETVWCVENRLGTLITRRNGKVAFVGNCQMLGRVHRTGQVLTPAYTQIAAEIPAEARPTAVLMKKMASLNANTTGARSSAFTVDSVDFINEVGDKVVSDILIEDPDLNDMLGEPLKFDEKGVPKKEDVARKATGRLVLLDPDVQTRFLDQVQKAYQAEIEQLDALGENPLEAKTVDLQAKQLDATEVKPKQGDSPFLDAVRIEKVSAKAQGRATPPSEVAGKVAEFLKVERPAADDAASLAALEAKGRTWKDSEVSRVTGLMRDQIREEVAATSADSRDSVRARLDAQLSRWQQTMNIAYPGSRITLGMPAGDLDGVVMSVERTGKAKQMTALGSWTVKIAVPDSMRVLEFPMSKLFPPNVVKSEDEKGATLVRSGTSHGALVAKFEDARKEGRETRYIVTGNILGGFDQTNGKGRIVNYTTEDGTLRPGILMGREFALDKFMGARRVRFQSGEQVARFLTDVPSAEVSSSVGEIVVSAYRGEYRIETAAAKQKAGQFFADRDILKTIAPSDFQRRGSKMIAFGLPRGVMAKVVDQMMANGAKFETSQSQEEAQKVIANGLREDATQMASSVSARANAEEDRVIQRIGRAIARGKTTAIPGHEVAFAHAVIEPDLALVPDGTIVATLTKVEPLPSRGAGAVKATFAEASGKVHTINVDWEKLSTSRALFVGGRRPAIFIAHFGIHGLKPFDARKVVLEVDEARVKAAPVIDEVTQMRLRIADGLRADFRHEIGHLLRSTGALAGVRWRRLVDHANSLSLLEMDVTRPASERVMSWRMGVDPVRTLEDTYREIYARYDNPQELIDQEAVSALLEQSWLGSLSDADVAPVRDILDDISKGNLKSSASPIGGGRMPLSALRHGDNITLAEKIANTRAVDELIASMPREQRRTLSDKLDLIVSSTTNGYLHYDIVPKGRPLWSKNGNSNAVGSFVVKAAQRATLRGVEVTNARLMEKYQRQGLGTTIYDMVDMDMESVGGLSPSPTEQLSPGAKAFWGRRLQSSGEILSSLRSIDSSIGQSMRRDLDSLGYYSKALEAAKALPQAKGTPEQMLAQLKKAGVKDAEIEATGLRAFFDGKKSITRDEIVKHLEGNRVELKEVVYQTGGQKPRRPGAERMDDFAAEGAAGPTKWFSYSLDPSNPTYRETVLHLPEAKPDFGKFRQESISNGITDEAVIKRNYDRLVSDPALMAREEGGANFRSGHFPEPNIVGHMMTSMTKHEGKPVYTIDQIQSDWGQKLRDGGVRDEARIADLKTKAEAARSAASDAIDDLGRRVGHSGGSQQQQLFKASEVAKSFPGSGIEEGVRKAEALLAEQRRLEAEYQGAQSSASGHPLVNTTDQWVNATLRRAIRQAAEAGAEFIAIPSGDTVLGYNPGDRNGMRQFYGSAPAEALIKINAEKRRDLQWSDAYKAELRAQKPIEGIVPKNLRKLLSAIDKATPAPAKIDTLDSPSGKTGLGRGFTLFRLTDEVKRSVMEEGQPMFSLVGGRVSQEASSLAQQLSEAVNLIARITGRDAVDVRFHDRISTAGVSTDQTRATQAAGFEARTAGGYYRQRRSIDAVPLIGLATGDPSFDLMTTAGHEAFHHVEDVLATPQERNLMASPSEMQRIRRLAGDELGLAAADPQLAALPDNEIRAIAFQRYRRMREEGLADASRIHIATRKFFDKLIRVFEGVRNLLRGRGYNSFESIFERARTGEMANAYADRGSPDNALQRVGAQEANDASQAVGDVLPEDAMAALIPAAIANRATNVMRRISLQPRTDAVRTYLQDKLLPLRRIQESIERQTGVALPVGVNTYKMESLYHGRKGERQADISTTFHEPLVKLMRGAKITTEQLDDYLYARHAEERNREIAPLHPAGSDFAEAVRDPDRVGGSGMSAREARDILARVAADPRAAEFARAASLIDRMIDETLDLEYQSGLITKEQYDENRRGVRWQHYVPLRGTEKEDISIPGRGRGFDVRGPEWKQALGRRTKADSPLSYAIQAAHMAVVRAEKNRVDKTLLRLVESYPDPAIWQVYKGEARRRVNPDTGLVETYWVPPGFVRKDNIFGAKVGGKQHYVEIKHEGLANALRTAPPGFWGTAPGRLFYKTARLYAQLVTSYNPEFMLSNSIRDLEVALLNIGDFANKPADLRRRIAKEALTLKSIRGVMAALQAHEGFTVMGGRRAADETMIGTKRSAEATAYAKWYDEYRLAGGKISFMDMFDVDEIKSQIDKDVAAGNAKRIVQSTFKLIDNANTAVENGVRLSTYIALRQHGISKTEAASVARELTVNFNRKGSAGPGINALYLFFNASIQGTTRMMQAISRSRAVQAAVVGIIGSGIVLDMLNYMVAGDDDDGENKYDKIKDWIKEKNIIIMLPGRKDYIMIPMAYGYNVPYLAGQNAMAAIRGAAGYGGIKPTTALANVLGAAVESFSPFGASKSWLQLVSPTLLDPFVQVAENKTFFGGKIQPEKRDKNKPDSENFYSTTPWWWVDMARTMNRWSGGNQASAGWADISPNTLAHYADFVAGGVGKFAMNLVATGERAVTGKDWLPEKTPFVRRVYGGKGAIESRVGEFYEAWTAIDAAHANVFQNAKAGRREDAQKARDESPAELQVWSAFKGTSQGLTVLRKKRDAINLDRTMSSEDKQKQLDEITRQENDRIVRVMKLYNQAKRDARKKGTSP